MSAMSQSDIRSAPEAVKQANGESVDAQWACLQLPMGLAGKAKTRHHAGQVFGKKWLACSARWRDSRFGAIRF